jgi:hypothetical protein
VTRETEEETIKRRSQNADAAIGCLFDGALGAFDWFWILLGLALLVYWLLTVVI